MLCQRLHLDAAMTHSRCFPTHACIGGVCPAQMFSPVLTYVSLDLHEQIIAAYGAVQQHVRDRVQACL